MWKVYALLNDKRSDSFKTFYEHDKELFTGENKQWRWVYFAVNEFEATQEQMVKLWVKTKRNIPFLTKLRYVFADIDIAKKWDGQAREEKERKKQIIVDELCKVMQPSTIIFTSNWLQPLRELSECWIDLETQKKYVAIINGVIERSKQYWWAWDEVKDVTRVVRLPWYYHMKEEPYMVTSKQYTTKKYNLDDFSCFIKEWDLDSILYNVKTSNNTTSYDNRMTKLRQYDEIDNIDFQDLITRAFQAVWRSCEFDKSWRAIIDWRLSGTFQGKKDNKDYLCSTSHEPFKWNRITAVSDIMNVSTKEAYSWILETFNIKTETELKRKDQKIVKEKEHQKAVEESFQHITQQEKYSLAFAELESRKPEAILKFWWREFDDLLWWIYPWRMYLIGAWTGIWKSSFVNAVCKNIASTGTRVVKYSLEDRLEDIAQQDIFYQVNKNRFSEFLPWLDPISFVNNEYWFWNKLYYESYFNEVWRAIEELSVYPIIELSRKKPVTPEELLLLIRQEADNGTKVFIVDHLHFLDFSTDKEQAIDQKLTIFMQSLNSLVLERNLSIFLVAHYVKSTLNEWLPNLDWFRWSWSIKQTVNVAIQIQENQWSRHFYITKLRGLRWAKAERDFCAEYNIFTGEYDFSKTEQQQQKENLFFKKN